MKKYNSITLIDDEEFIQKAFEQHPELNKELFIATEKVDGANLGITKNDGKLVLQSRNKELTESDDFYDYERAFSEIKDRVLDLPDLNKYILFGEIYGNNVQKRIPYSVDPKIIFFDVFDKETEEYLSFEQQQAFFNSQHLPIVPYVASGKFQDIIGIDVEALLSKVSGYKDTYAEGVVIRPLSMDIMIGQTRFILKKKAERFYENRKGNHIESKPKSKKIKDWYKVLPYCNENIMASAMSKFPSNEASSIIEVASAETYDNWLKDHPDFTGDKAAVIDSIKKHMGPLYGRLK